MKDDWLGCQECDPFFTCYDGESSCIRLEKQLTRYPSFRASSTVKHLRSGKHFTIIEEPNRVRISNTNKPAYLYKGIDEITWVLSQDEMEDGRFKLI